MLHYNFDYQSPKDVIISEIKNSTLLCIVIFLSLEESVVLKRANWTQNITDYVPPKGLGIMSAFKCYLLYLKSRSQSIWYIY